MKMVYFLVLLLSLILFATTAYAAEEANMTGTDNETVQDGVITEDHAGLNESLLSGESARAFGTLHRNMLMVAEEAFDYLLTGKEDQKQAFLDEYASIADDTAAFEKTIDLNADNAADLKVVYDDMVAAINDMGATAETMFASYDANKTVVPADVEAFEQAVDRATMSASAAWNLNDNATPLSVNSTRNRLNAILLEAIEESYAYPIIGNETEKTDARAKFDEFDEILAQAKKDNPDASFEDQEIFKTDLMTAAQTMFTSFETNGSVSPDDIAVFEAVVESFNAFAGNTISTGTETDQLFTVNTAA